MGYTDIDKQREYQRDWIKRNRDPALIAERKKKLIKRHQERVIELKSKPCLDCGRRFPYVCMDFDHLGDKKHNIANMISGGWSWKAIQAEIAKCELVCSNCHRIRTHERFLAKLNNR